MPDDRCAEFMEGASRYENEVASIPYGLCQGFPIPFQVRGNSDRPREYYPLWIPRANLFQKSGRERGLALRIPGSALLRLNRRAPAQIRTVQVAWSSAQSIGGPPRVAMLLAALVGGMISGRLSEEPLGRDLHAIACRLAQTAQIDRHACLWRRRMWRTLPDVDFVEYEKARTLQDVGEISAAILSRVLGSYMPARVYLEPVESGARQDGETLAASLSALSMGSINRSPMDWIVMAPPELRERVRQRPLEVMAREWCVSKEMVSRMCIRKGVEIPPKSYWHRIENRGKFRTDD